MPALSGWIATADRRSVAGLRITRLSKILAHADGSRFRAQRETLILQQLADEIMAGRVKQPFIFGGDPVFNALRGLAQDPETKQPLDWPDLQKKCPKWCGLVTTRTRLRT